MILPITTIRTNVRQRPSGSRTGCLLFGSQCSGQSRPLRFGQEGSHLGLADKQVTQSLFSADASKQEEKGRNGQITADSDCFDVDCLIVAARLVAKTCCTISDNVQAQMALFRKE